ncbi:MULTISPECIES: AvrD family protein [unclassified Streptomyces]|uniref:AvrD family protein n=1 Tax=unclassified Streptomyces TaxID=2593676 RepID=UPI0021AC3684|nr:AvrD family protein [Streptomyces sp. PsTaAH-137]
MTTSIDRHLLLPSIDDYLGPGETRFFSRGYQRAEYRVGDLVVAPVDAPDAGVRGTVDVSYPADWSRKKDGTDLRPHLSTVDALVLGVQLAELHLTYGYGLDAAARRRMRLVKVVLRAGGAPQEELADIPLAARLVRTTAMSDREGRFRSVHNCTVGNLQVRCEIEHDISVRAVREARFDGLEDALGPDRDRFWGGGFKHRRHHIREVGIDLGEFTARADVTFDPETEPAPDGIEGDRRSAVSLIDAFVVNLQLAQVLLYELDSISRSESNTLWMMQTVLEAPPEQPLRTGPDTHAARATLSSRRLLPLRGGLWRSVEITGELAGVQLRCGFAHELPPSAVVAD